MGELAEGTVQLLNYLISGFLTAWIFYSLTPFRINNQFERVIQALIFTVIIKSSYSFIEWLLLLVGETYYVGKIYSNTEDILPLFLAIFYGFLFSYISNNDYIHRISRYLGISQEHSYVSEWFYAFKSNPGKCIIIQTKNDSTFDGQRIYGYPSEFPSQHIDGHFNIYEPSWVVEEKNDDATVSSILLEMSGVESILVPSEAVAWIEFIKPADDSNP